MHDMDDLVELLPLGLNEHSILQHLSSSSYSKGEARIRQHYLSPELELV